MLRRLGPGRSNGNILRNFDSAGIILNEIEYAAMTNLLSHSHENAHFCFVLEGSYVETHVTQKLQCDPLTLTFCPPGELHEDRFRNLNARVLTVEIPTVWIERLRQDSLSLGSARSFQGGLITTLAKRLYNELYFMDTAANLTIEGLTLEIMAEAARRVETKTNGTVPLWLKQAKDLLHARFSENLTLETIASEVRVHPVHLAATFRQKYNCTVGEYVRQLRVEYACQQIDKGDAKLSTIAMDAGFANQGHFSNTFKRLTGRTPTEYRSSLHSLNKI